MLFAKFKSTLVVARARDLGLILSLASSNLFAFEETVSRTGSIELSCQMQRLSDRYEQDARICPLRFISRHAAPQLLERYTLAHRDSAGVFEYYMLNRLPITIFSKQPFYMRPPILGGLRDRFIDNVPTYSKLLFTTIIAGFGVYTKLAHAINIRIDSSLIHLFQRYLGNFTHTTIPIDTVLNSEYQFDTLAFLTEFNFTVKNIWNSTFEYRLWLLLADGLRFFDIEHHFNFRHTFYQNKTLKSGVFARFFYRTQNLRQTRISSHFDATTLGIYVDF